MTQPYQNTIKHTVDLTNQWIDQLDEILDWDDKKKALRLMRFTLQSLRDILPVDEAAQLSAQLPLLIRGMFYEGWDPSDRGYEGHDKEGFLERIDYMMGPDEIDDLEGAASSVFQLLNAHISEGEIKDVRANLREKLRDLWPAVKT